VQADAASFSHLDYRRCRNTGRNRPAMELAGVRLALAGATMLVLFRLLPWQVAFAAVGSGTDVYFFLVGMMLLSEAARKQGLFNWLGSRPRRSRTRGGSAKRLFLIIYVVGTRVTVFLSNDATAVVMTPAVYAAAKAAQVEPLRYLLICAFIANAASFALPIANPANLIVFGGQMPALSEWLRYFCRAVLYCNPGDIRRFAADERRALEARVTAIKGEPSLTFGGKLAAVGIAFTGVVLPSASAFGWPLGLPTFCAGASLTAIVLVIARQSPLLILEDVSWSVLPLVAGLFVLVAGVNQTGVVSALACNLHDAAAASPQVTSWVAGIIFAVSSNLLNNLPMGLIAAATNHAAQSISGLICP
jgi:arsenical pump membrane protein